MPMDMGSVMPEKIPGEELYAKTLEPYEKELGSLLIKWNDLHLALAMLFVALNGAYLDEQDGQVLLSIWNAVPNERFQRNMLRQAAITKLTQATEQMRKDGIVIQQIADDERATLAEITWIVDSADKLGRQRDDAAHIPMTIQAGDTLTFVAADFLGHPIAEQFSKKNLLDEFNLCAARITAINNHAREMYWFLYGKRQPSLPRRPIWPTSPRPSEHKDGKEQ